MNDDKVRRFQGERGASLILAIAFMVVVGAISAAVLATTTSGLQDRVALDQARNREYDADGAIETTIAQARGAQRPVPATPATPFTLNNSSVGIHVDCTSAAAIVNGPATSLCSEQSFICRVRCDGTRERNALRIAKRRADHHRSSQLPGHRADGDHVRPSMECERMNTRVLARKTESGARGEAGFTLLEMVISVVLLTLITGAISAAFVSSLNATSATKTRVTETNDAELIGRVLHP